MNKNQKSKIKNQNDRLKFKNFRFWIVILHFTFCILHFAEGSGPGTTSANFLKIGIGARPVAMGEAFVAVADDANTIVHNPAGLAQLSQKEFSAMHLEYFQNIKYEALSYLQPFKFGTAGISLGYLYMNDIKRTYFYEEEYYKEAGEFGAADRTAVLGFGKKLGSRHLSADYGYGLAVRFIRETLESESATAFALDIGLLCNRQLIANYISLPLSFGIAIQNIGTQMKFIEVKEKLPIILRTGVCWNVSGKRGINSPLLAFEFYKPSDNYPELKLGSEIWLFDLFAPRIGYRYRTWARNNYLGDLSGLTAGLGIKIYNYTVDYAFVPYGDLGYTHRFSLGGRF
ncbi:MAG: PorV/PorQ family protein [Elusimicrobiota bacterium]